MGLWLFYGLVLHGIIILKQLNNATKKALKNILGRCFVSFGCIFIYQNLALCQMCMIRWQLLCTRKQNVRMLIWSTLTVDCEWKAQAGNVCVASFDWTCSGICRSVERMKEVHRRCGEGENALWSAEFWHNFFCFLFSLSSILRKKEL